MKNFIIFILTHGRADHVVTYRSLKNSGYTGRVMLVVDDEDKQIDKYRENFGDDKVWVFNKKEVEKRCDKGDNNNNNKVIFHARNVCFDIAKELGITYFMELDDDYGSFQNRFLSSGDYYTRGCTIRSLDDVLKAVLSFYKSVPALKSIAFAQGGDFIGGRENNYAQVIKLRRKCMNSFICSTKRPFTFIGKINEDVNTYTHIASKGFLFFTLNQLLIGQPPTQTSEGGMSGTYLESGTYLKSFYSIMFQPSSVKVQDMGIHNRRLHHRINWNNTCPLIVAESHKKE